MSDVSVEIQNESDSSVKTPKSTIDTGEKGMNPWIRLSLYIFMIIIGGTIYWGWTGIQSLLYKAGSFEELCYNEEYISLFKVGNNNYINCGKRRSGINNLFTIAYASHLLCTILNGFLLDHIGPKYAYMIAQICNFIAWILIGTFPRNAHMLKFSFFLLGSTAEGTVMPLITVSYFFERRRTLIIHITGAAISISFMISLILEAIFSSDRMQPSSIYIVTIGYAFLGNFLCLLLGLFFVHKKLPKSLIEPRPSVSFGDLRNLEGDRVIDDSGHSEGSPLNLKSKQKIHRFIEATKVVVKSKKFKEFIILLFCTSVFLSSIEFINKSQREILTTSDGKSSVNIFKYSQFLNFILTTIIGFINDKVGPPIVNFVLYLCIFAFLLIVTIDAYPAKVISIFFYFVAASPCISSLYSYITKRFPSGHFGTLSGIILLFCGLLSLSNIPIYDMAASKTRLATHKAFMTPLYIYLGVMCLVLFFAGVLIFMTQDDKENKDNYP